MTINTDINILGGLPDWNLIQIFLDENMDPIQEKGGIQSYTSIKTQRSVTLFEKAINRNLLTFKNNNIKSIVSKAINLDGITNDILIILFWNASANNDLLYYLNDQVYFPAFYSGRVALRKAEVLACIKDLREREQDLKKWSESTMEVTSSKYLTLMMKFGLMQGSAQKSIVHPYISDQLFVLFVYWLVAMADKPNLVDSPWLKYSFHEKLIFIERLMQNKFSKYYNVFYTGDNLKVEPVLPYEMIYEYATKS